MAVGAPSDTVEILTSSDHLRGDRERVGTELGLRRDLPLLLRIRRTLPGEENESEEDEESEPHHGCPPCGCVSPRSRNSHADPPPTAADLYLCGERTSAERPALARAVGNDAFMPGRSSGLLDRNNFSLHAVSAARLAGRTPLGFPDGRLTAFPAAFAG